MKNMKAALASTQVRKVGNTLSLHGKLEGNGKKGNKSVANTKAKPKKSGVHHESTLVTSCTLVSFCVRVKLCNGYPRRT